MVAFDVVEDILLRSSDANDLLRCKSVCKSWYSLISTPRFAQAHLKTLTACNNNNNYIRIGMPTYWKTVDKLSDESLYQFNRWRVVGSANGLVCFSRLVNDVLMVVNNPLTREVTTLPMPPIYPKNGVLSICISLSFGYDASSDDYKVVMGIKENSSETLIQVLSLKSNTWNTIGRFKYTLLYNRSGIMFNGSFYWIGFDSTQCSCNIEPWKGRKQVILSFDLSREVFTIIPQPNDPRYSSGRISLGITENQLRLYLPPSDDNNLPGDIWVMRSHGSWERLPKDCEMTHEVIHLMSMLEFSSPMYNHQQRINFFFADNKCLPKPWKNYTNAHIYTPSLVSPYVNFGRPSHPTDNNTFAHAWSVEVPQAEFPHTQAKTSKFVKASERIEEIYRREVGEAENFYLHEDGETGAPFILGTSVNYLL